MSWHYGPLAGPEEDDPIREMLTQCFNFPVKRWPSYVEQMGRENFRRIVRDGKVVAALGVYPLGQWFGGRSVPTGGVAVVGVPPEERGGGAAFELMAEMLREQHRRGVPLSTLYPATQRLYRKVGYEQAGTHCRHSIPADQIHSSERPLPVEPIPVAEHEVLHGAYGREARRSAGNLDRSPAFWTRLVTSPEDPIFAYVLGSRKNPEGYLVLTQSRITQTIHLQVRDLVTLTPRAARAAWTFLAGHRSVVGEISWFGPSVDPRAALLPEQETRLAHGELWFLRIVDVKAALEQRGYPEAVEAELALEVRDEIVSENEGRYRIRLSGGRAEVARESGAEVGSGTGGSGEVGPALRLHVRALASLYSGLYTAGQLVDLGWIEGDAAGVAAAERIFAGPEPWMPDGF